METNFKATTNTTTRIITSIIFALFIGFLILGLLEESGNSIIGALVLGFTIFVCGLFAPIKYSITEKSVRIHRLIGQKIVARNEIETVFVLQKDQFIWSIRTFGVGGLFGYYGKFYNSDLGHMTWFLTRTDRAVLIVTKSNKKFLLSPDEIDGFISTAGF